MKCSCNYSFRTREAHFFRASDLAFFSWVLFVFFFFHVSCLILSMNINKFKRTSDNILFLRAPLSDNWYILMQKLFSNRQALINSIYSGLQFISCLVISIISMLNIFVYCIFLWLYNYCLQMSYAINRNPLYTHSITNRIMYMDCLSF